MDDKKPNILSIVRQLARVRKEAGLQQAELALRAGVNRMTVSRIESGYDPRLSTFHELARALGMELMLVPKGLRDEVEGFIQSGGRVLAQPPGVGAPRSVVDMLGEEVKRGLKP